MRKNDDEKVEDAEVGDKGNKKELDDITSMCKSVILKQIHNIPVQETQPSTSGIENSSLTESVSEEIKMVASVNLPPNRTSECEIFKVMHSVTETENEIPNIPSSTPPPTYYRTPPTYSAVMRMGPNPRDPKKILEMDSSKIFARVPPPSYAEVEGIWSDLPRQNSCKIGSSK